MERMIYTNTEGESLELGNSPPYILKSISGAGGIDVDIQLQKAPFQDGKTYIDNVVNERLITLNVVILSETEEERFQYRRGILRMFNPKLGIGTLTYLYDGGSREIQVIPKTTPVFNTDDPEAPNEQLETNIHILAPSPFWLDSLLQEIEMADWIGGLQFPLEITTEGIPFSISGSEVHVFNDGDVDAPVLIEFNGPALNPQVENLTTRNLIRIGRTLEAGDKLIIDTSFGNKSIRLLHGEKESNVMHWIDLQSKFWQLIPGENVIKYSADEGAEEATVQVTWKNRFVGV